MPGVSLHIRSYHPQDRDAVVQLWNACGLVVPANDPDADIQTKRAFQPELLLVGETDGRLVATVMAGYDGHRGWINYLAVSPEMQRQGIGRLMMNIAEKRLETLGCPKINLQVRSANTGVIAFYQRLGFRVDDVVSLGKRLKPGSPPSTR
jgi:ribosomal protein S18 acetylase RimI-like enzyme